MSLASRRTSVIARFLVAQLSDSRFRPMVGLLTFFLGPVCANALQSRFGGADPKSDHLRS